MTQRIKASLTATLCAAALLAATGAAQAQTTSCRSLIGFNTLLVSPLDPPSGAWAVTEANGDSFLGKKDVADCAVKVVTGPKARISATIYEAGPMTQNECSVYNSLSSIDSKLAQGKNSTAYDTVTTLISRVDGWAGTAKLVDPGYGAIRTSLTAVQSCIMNL